MKYGDGYIVPGTCGFSITVAKIHKPGASKSFGVNCRYCSTGVFHAQVIPESDFMHRLAVALLATAAIVGISVSASAADLPRKAPAYIPPAPLPYNWTGFYVGLNAGGSWGRQTNLYINFGDGPTVPVGTAFVGASGKLTDNIVRVGVNYKSI
jgi:hypothetical protein